MKRFAVHEVPLQGVQLVEASAGTGKTHALTDLIVRLVVEAGCPIRSVLAVTFTVAATDELKVRVRERLSALAERLAAGDCSEPALRAIAEGRVDSATGLRRLRDAIRSYDEASIFTIHSFCQRALSDHAFDSGARFETEIAEAPEALVAEIVGDFWRARIATQPSVLAGYLQKEKIGPESLRTTATRLLSRRRPILRPPVRYDPAALAAAHRPFAEAVDRARAIWTSKRAEVERLLMDSPALRRNRLNTRQIPKYLEQLDDWLAAAIPPMPEKAAQFTTDGIKERTRKRCAPPAHELFEALQAVANVQEALAEALKTAWLGLFRELLESLPSELERRAAAAGERTYDQLLTGLAAALEGPQADRLIRALRAEYAVALIDEFQDTDALQYEIFRRIFEGHGAVFFIGDPKQSIYRFRGADLFTYRRAARAADDAFTLTENWRSEAPLVRALNALFDRGSDRPFLLDGIAFPPVNPAAAARIPPLRDEAAAAPLRIFFLARSPNAPAAPLGRGEAAERALRATVAEIVRLLAAGREGRIALGDRPLGAGDLAVLCRSRSQCEEVYAALTRHGVPCVLYTQFSVFATPEAASARRVLEAVARPWRESLVRGALLVDWMGGTAADLDRYQHDAEAWAARLERFRDYHRRWREQGFLQMFQALLAGEGVAPRLLAGPRGERRLTNLRHLAELAHEAARTEGFGMDGLLEWWTRAMSEAETDADERQLRLESDEARVRILTIHVSKGLQFPVVFVPFAWSVGPSRQNGRGAAASGSVSFVEFHDPDRDDALTVELDPETNEKAQRLDSFEDQAESLRLFYVALTRARNRAYFAWGAVSEAENSAPAWFIHRPPPVENAQACVSWESLPDEAIRGDLRRIGDVAGGGLEIIELAEAPDVGVLPPAATLSAERQPRRFGGRIADDWRVASFSALVAAAEAADPDRPDRDESAPPAAAGAEEAAAAPAAAPVAGIHAFPRGPRAGSLLHAVFERLDFDADTDTVRTVVAELLSDYGFDSRWAPAVVETFERVRATSLSADDPELRLAAVPRARRTDEMEFHFPLARISANGLAGVFRAHGVVLPISGLPETIGRLQFSPLRGFMKGYVDLVFERGGRFALADYKSNWLGLTAEAYTSERIAAEMASANYGLQYYIYTVALHRLLRYRRGAAYDYERDFAGVYYLFLRGMSPKTGPTRGVFHDRPPRALVEALSEYFACG